MLAVLAGLSQQQQQEMVSGL